MRRLAFAALAFALLSAPAARAATPDGQGRAELRSRTQAVVDRAWSADLVFTVGLDGMADGGGIRFYTPPTAWATPPVTDRHVRLQSRSRAKARASVETRGVLGWIVTITASGAGLKPGDRIVYRYETAHVQLYSQQGLVCRLESDVDGDGKFASLPEDAFPRVDVHSDRPAALRVVAPTIARPGQRIAVRSIVLDAFRNPAEQRCDKPIRIGLLGSETEVAFRDNRAEFEIAAPDKPGIYHIHGLGEGLAEVYLPIKVTDDPDLNVYWGQLHGHTAFSDGVGTIDEYYTYGRDVGFLDFCVANDHAWQLSVQNKWPEAIAAVRNHYEPGRYVTLAGYEWTIEGHRNVYFADTTDDLPLHHRNEVGANTYPEFVAKLRAAGKEVILGYHTAHPVDLNGHDPEFQKLVELHSMWGTSEYPGNPGWTKLGDKYVPQSCAQAALARGQRLGFVAGGDSHHGRPGRFWYGTRWNIMGHKEGAAAVIAPKLDRRTIFDALKNRHTYGATGERILLLFTINGHGMGDEFQADGPLRIHFEVGGTGPLTSVELLRDNQTIWAKNLDGLSYTNDIEDNSLAPGGVHWYYLRVTQKSGDRAWSSPIWVSIKNP